MLEVTLPEQLRERIEPFDRFRRAIEAIDGANDEDPRRLQVDGKRVAYELHFSRALFDRVLQLNPQASEALLLAARGQHICRWKIPREDYPMDRPGYLKWRSDLKRYHASKAREILSDLGYEESMLDRVEALNLKKGLSNDPECQTLEDSLCLVFLDLQFGEFRERADDEKMVRILRKTWGKMSPAGREAALKLEFDEACRRLVDEALS